MHAGDLPREVRTPRALVRRASDADLAQLERWPPYPWPFTPLGMTEPSARSPAGPYWWQQIRDEDRAHYSVVLRATDEVVGVLAFVSIDWDSRMVRNMGVRIREDWRGEGLCTEVLSPLLDAVIAAGIERVRLDVAASNAGGIRCYEKCGMTVTSEDCFPHTGEEVDLDDQRWAFARGHMKRVHGEWMVRHLWMERRA